MNFVKIGPWESYFTTGVKEILPHFPDFSTDLCEIQWSCSHLYRVAMKSFAKNWLCGSHALFKAVNRTLPVFSTFPSVCAKNSAQVHTNFEWLEFCENSRSKSNTLLSGLKKIVSVLPYLLSDLCEIWHKRFKHNAVQHLRVCNKSA